MKRTAKGWLLAGAFLVVLGLLVFAVTMTVHRWDFSALSSTRMETNTLEIRDAFDSISIRTDTDDIVFLPSGDGKCSVVFYEEEKVKHRASVRNGTLVIDAEDTRTWLDRIGFSFGAARVTVCLPRGDYASLTVGESTGDVTVPGDFTFERMEITVSTGSVNCSAPVSGKLQIKTGTGGIRLEELSAGELSLTASTGGVELRSVACRGGIELNVSTGKALLKDVACRDLISGGSTGDLTLENVIASERISVERSTGDVRFEGCDAGELSVRTDTGDVTGTLLSGKVFLVQSDTGRVEVPKTVSGGRCEIATDTGDILIETP